MKKTSERTKTKVQTSERERWSLVLSTSMKPYIYHRIKDEGMVSSIYATINFSHKYVIQTFVEFHTMRSVSHYPS